MAIYEHIILYRFHGCFLLVLSHLLFNQAVLTKPWPNAGNMLNKYDQLWQAVQILTGQVIIKLTMSSRTEAATKNKIPERLIP